MDTQDDRHDHYVPNPDGPLAKGLPPGFMRHYWHSADQRRESPENRSKALLLIWVCLALALQMLAFSGLTARDSELFGLVAMTVNAALTPLPLFLLLGWLLPALVFTFIVPPPGVPFRRAALCGLAFAAALLLFSTLLMFLHFLDLYRHSGLRLVDFLQRMHLRR